MLHLSLRYWSILVMKHDETPFLAYIVEPCWTSCFVNHDFCSCWNHLKPAFFVGNIIVSCVATQPLGELPMGFAGESPCSMCCAADNEVLLLTVIRLLKIPGTALDAPCGWVDLPFWKKWWMARWLEIMTSPREGFGFSSQETWSRKLELKCPEKV